jgi:hypothetical protein
MSAEKHGGAALRPEHQLLLACARVRLDAERVTRVRDLAAQQLDFPFLLSEARRHCVAPLLFWHLREACPAIVPPDFLESLRQEFEATTQRNLYLASHLLEVSRILKSGGVLAVPYKGPVLASLAYGNLALRPFGDLDLLIRQTDVLRALELLATHHYRAVEHRRGAIPGQYACRAHAGNALVEFHTEQTLRYFPRPMDMEAVMDRLQPVSVSGHSLQTLAMEDLLLVLCVHGTKHLWDRLIWICDIAELLRGNVGMDWQKALDTADQLGARRILRLGLYVATRLLGIDLVERIPAIAPAEAAEVKWLASQVERQLFGTGHGPMEVARRALFRLRSRESTWEGLRHVFQMATTPSEEDWQSVELPRHFSVLYRAIRPFRLVRDHGLRRGNRAEGPPAPVVEPFVRLGHATARKGESILSPQEGMIRLTRSGMAFVGSQADVDSLRHIFEREHCLLLRGFLGGDLVPLVLPLLKRAQFSPAHYEHVGSELLMEPNAALEILTFLSNDQKLFDLVETITRCQRISSFYGRVYKLAPNPDHTFDWHDDLHEPSRLLAMSLNLSTDQFRGGLLQIREVASGNIIHEVANTGFGDAVMFRLTRDLEHRVTPVDGDTPKISYAGWFKTQPNIYSSLRQLRDQRASREKLA